MRTVKTILSLILVLALLGSGLPVFCPHDANQDRQVDLDDAILHVREFAGTAEKPSSFEPTVEKTIFTLHVLAGLKTHIKPAKEAKSTAFQPDSVYLPSLIDLPFHFDRCSQLNETFFSYESIVMTPDAPPPKPV
jgi:hypothetical protein